MNWGCFVVLVILFSGRLSVRFVRLSVWANLVKATSQERWKGLSSNFAQMSTPTKMKRSILEVKGHCILTYGDDCRTISSGGTKWYYSIEWAGAGWLAC